MTKFLLNYFSNRFLSKWIVLLFDMWIVFISFQIAFLTRFGFDYSVVNQHITIEQTFLALAVFFGFMIVFGSFSGVLRHSGITDAIKIAKMGALSSLLLFFIALAIPANNHELHLYAIPKGVILIQGLLVILLLLTSRVLVRAVYKMAISNTENSKTIAIYGAGTAGLIAKHTIEKDKKTKIKLCCFIDDNKKLRDLTLDGIKVVGPKDFFNKRTIAESNVTELVIAIGNLNTAKKDEIVEKALEFNLKIKIVPSVNKWINGELKASQIKEVKIEDLLERQEIILDNHYLHEELKDKVVLVSGAAGSIGSEIVRQLIPKNPKRIVLFDQAESPLHNLRMELESKLCKMFPQVELVYFIGDIRQSYLVESMFNKYKPEIVFHAAAYKHVPLMEEYPSEAVHTNVLGTKNLAKLSVINGVQKFVFVSTDKAVNPTNVMGASKRIAEIYINSLSKTQDRTKFITTRFGNVLGSNGSVIPLFRDQIAKGGPITVTHPSITRYFMTIPEACQLVLEAGTMGKGGEIFIFDMGQSVKIVDVAKKMIKLSGLNYPDDIDIEFTGLRPGEKLYEELLANKENTLPTYHPKIMLANNRELINYHDAISDIDMLIELIGGDNNALVSKMKEIVPEFISNNSIFNMLDKDSKNIV